MALLRSGLIHVCLALLIAGGWCSPEGHAVQDEELLDLEFEELLDLEFSDATDLILDDDLLGRKAPELNPAGTWLITEKPVETDDLAGHVVWLEFAFVA